MTSTDLDPRSVDLEDGLPDGEGAVVPHGEEEEHQVQDAGVEVQGQARDHATYKIIKEDIYSGE